ncbi:hypothetical protein Poly24_46240 [Rosistilla carotiformis]|uniref:Abortive infection protein-like C-terminal domain-containing protein n=1 Tax=Rosistilla carotiformis TaxID=2528017 RepID=A0A518JZC3_9BACT|nr:hypothetical protein [Rosistilla carotiformis]QDV70891.1 hypothetical protein Poly24_46240 [Rosistilla carotiformis]
MTTEFNRMTVVAAAEVISAFKSHNDMAVLEVEWGVAGRCDDSSKSARVASLSRIAIEENLTVLSENGNVGLCRALVETALTAPESTHEIEAWKRLIAGLHFDGFEIDESKNEIENSWGSRRQRSTFTLIRMLPDDIPGLDFREAGNEIEILLDKCGFTVAKGHLRQALSAFQRGEWSSANGELRNFYECYLNEIANGLGYTGPNDSKLRRDYLGSGVQSPFLLEAYNEWNANNQKPQFVQGLMSRMHPHGGHPGLSEEEDATFRIQISLVTARLFLRRYNQRRRS